MSDLRAGSFERRAADRVAGIGSEVSLDAFAASFDLIRLATRVMQDLEQAVLRHAGWTMAAFRVMFVVWVGEALEPRQIARLSGLSRAAVSNVLNALEREGSLRRSHESSDRRLVTVRLSPEGERRLIDSYRRQNARERQLFGALTPGETQALLHAMRKLLNGRFARPPEVQTTSSVRDSTGSATASLSSPPR